LSDICASVAGYLRLPSAAHRDPAVRERARILLIDTLACLVAGRAHAATGKLVSVLRAGGGDALALASGRRMAPAFAVLETGTAIRALDFNDFYWGPGLGGHPSDIFATALVVGEMGGHSLDRVLDAALAGYDLYIGLLDQMDPHQAFDHTTAGAFASAAMAGVLLGLDEDAQAHALAMALARGPAMAALRQGAISEVKAASAALACMNGVLAAEFAGAGLTGPCGAIGGAHGLESFLRPGRRAADVLPRPDDVPGVMRVAIKRYPCIGTAQAAVAGAVSLNATVQARGLKRLSVRLADNPVVAHQTGEEYRHPTDRETADHSFYAVMAMALADGDLTLDQYARMRWNDDDIARLADRFSLAADLPGAVKGRFPAMFRAELPDGEVLELDQPLAPGHPESPLDLGGVLAKFQACAKPLLGAKATETAMRQLAGADGSIGIGDILGWIMPARWVEEGA